MSKFQEMFELPELHFICLDGKLLRKGAESIWMNTYLFLLFLKISFKVNKFQEELNLAKLEISYFDDKILERRRVGLNI